MRFFFQYPDLHGIDGDMLDAGPVADLAIAAEVRKLAGSLARIIDLRGATVYVEPADGVLRRGEPASFFVASAEPDGGDLFRMASGRIVSDTFA